MLVTEEMERRICLLQKKWKSEYACYRKNGKADMFVTNSSDWLASQLLTVY